MIRKLIASSVLALALVSTAPAAMADGGPTGLGIVVGDPTGVSLKHWLTEGSAIDAAFAWSVGKHSVFGVHADYLLHVPALVQVGSAEFPLHYGVGGLLIFGDASAFALRIPVGLSHRFERHPVDIFTEIAGLLFVAPETDFDIHLALGARYYF